MRRRRGSRLVKRGDVFWFRWTVPESLRAAFGRREIWRSLRTTDPALARRKADQLLDALYAQSARFEDQARSAKAAASLPEAVQVIRGDFFERVEVTPAKTV